MFLRYNVNAKGNAQSIRFVNKKKNGATFLFFNKNYGNEYNKI